VYARQMISTLSNFKKRPPGEILDFARP